MYILLACVAAVGPVIADDNSPFRFAEEFPNVQFIAHEFTLYVMNSTRIAYIDRSRNFIKNNLAEFQKIVATGVDSDGNEINEGDVASYRRIIDDADAIDFEFNRAKVTPPNVVFTDNYTIESGDRIIELRHLGHANTAGDIVMWLPEERIVATGDIVVLPSPYAFNVPPRAWAATLRAVNELDYSILVPGHGDIQTDTAYVDLVIEVAESIADQRDAMLADGMSNEDVQQALDFSAFEDQFTHGDAYIKDYYDAWFEHFYIRPHQSGNPDANQYTPVFNGVSAWQLYHGALYAGQKAAK